MYYDKLNKTVDKAIKKLNKKFHRQKKELEIQHLSTYVDIQKFGTKCQKINCWFVFVDTKTNKKNFYNFSRTNDTKDNFINLKDLYKELLVFLEYFSKQPNLY